MATVTLPITSRTSSDDNDFADVVGNDQAITTQVNGNLDNSNIASGAAIAYSKLDSLATGQALIGNGTTPTATTLTGDVTVGATGVMTIGAAKVTGAMLAADVVGVYRTILSGGGNFPSDAAAGTYRLDFGSGWAASLSASGGTVEPGPPMVYLDDADYAIAGRTTKLRLRTQVHTNATSVGAMVISTRLFPVTVAGAANTLSYTLGTVVSGATAIVTNPPISAITSAVGSDFTFPSDGLYIFCCTTDATMAQNSAMAVTAQLQVHHT